MKLTSASYLNTKQDGSIELVATPGPRLASSWYCFGLGGLGLVFALLSRDVTLAAIGALLFGGGVFLLRGVKGRITVILSDGTVTITTSWVFGGKKSVRTISAQEVNRVDYAEAFNDKTILGLVRRYSSVYLTLKNGENIEVLKRRGVKYIQPLYIGSFTKETPLADEAKTVAAQLRVPLNTIPFKNPTDIKNVFTPNDHEPL